MRKVVILLLLVCVFSSVFSQTWEDKKNLIGIGYGSIGSNLIVHSSHSFEETNPRNSFNIEYLRRLSDKFCLGGSFAYHIQTGDSIHRPGGLVGEYIDIHAVDNCISLSAIGRYYYYQGKIFSFYSQLGVGLKQSFIKYSGTDLEEIEKDKESGLFPTIQWYLIGIEAGNSKWKLFFQVGASGEGVSKVGLRYGL